MSALSGSVVSTSLKRAPAHAREAAFVLTTALVSAFAFVSCFFRLFIFPHTPVLPVGDAVGFFESGSRIVVGQLPYRDFVEILPVGADVTYAALIKLFGPYTWVPAIVMTFLAAGCAALVTLVSRRITRGSFGVFPALLFLGVLLLDQSLNATHHWFCTLFALAAIMVLLDGITYSRVAAAGSLAGIATCYTQTTGAMVVLAMALYIVCTRREAASVRSRKALLVCGVAIAVFFAVNGYFIWQAGLHDWFFYVVVYPIRYFRIPAINNWRVLEHDFGGHPSLRRWLAFPFLYATVPLIYFVALYARFRRDGDSDEPWDEILLITLTGLGMFAAIASAPSFLRLSSASLPGMILLSWWLDRAGQTGRRIAIIAVSVSLLFAVGVPLHRQIKSAPTLELPGGRTAFLDPSDYEEYRWMASHTHPGQYFFGMPPMFMPLHLLNPAPVGGLDTTDYTRPDQVAASLRAINQHPVPLIVIRGPLDLVVTSAFDHTGSFRTYLHANYELTKTFPNGDRAWQRIDSLQ